MTIAIGAAVLLLFAFAVLVAILLVRGGHQDPVVGDFNQQALTRVIERHERDQAGKE